MSRKLENVLPGTRTVAFLVLAQATLSAQALYLVSDQDPSYRRIQKARGKFRYLKRHRPCVFPETRTEAKEKQRKLYRYENRMTPCDRFTSRPGAKDYLKPGLRF